MPALLLRRLTLLAFVLPLLLLSCRSSSMRSDAPEAKFDAPLRRAVAEQERSGQLAPLPVLVGCTGSMQDETVAALETDGLRITTVTGRIATAEGLPEALRKAARRDFVERIELSKTSTLKKRS